MPKITPTQADARRRQREIGAELSAWFESRRIAARKRARARVYVPPSRGRGVDRVPEHLLEIDSTVRTEIEMPEVGRHRGVPMSRAQRRANGQRAHRPQRLRSRRAARIDSAALDAIKALPAEHTQADYFNAIEKAVRWTR